MPVQKGKQKGFSISNFALLLVVSNWHRGSEGVNEEEGEEEEEEEEEESSPNAENKVFNRKKLKIYNSDYYITIYTTDATPSSPHGCRPREKGDSVLAVW